jgi:hypothetical protein
MKILKQNIKIPALTGKRTIAKATDLFTGWIDLDFKNWSTDVKGIKTKATELACLEIEKNGTFKDIFETYSKDLDSLVLTEDQIIEYVEKNQDLIHDWYTFFLFKVNDEFFVARVYGDDGELKARVYRFSYEFVWGAEYRCRVVIPQLALKTSSAISLEPSATLSLEAAIAKVKEAGYQVSKIL